MYIVEEKIKEAIENGEFDNLPGQGKPLQLRGDLQGLSPEIRRAYRILKNAGYIPEEANQQKKNIQMDDLIEYATDGKVKDTIQKRKHFETFIKERNLASNSKFSVYAKKIYKKLF